MVKHPFVVGFLVAEIPGLELGRGSHDASQFPSPEECYALPPTFDLKSPEIPLCSEKPLMYLNLSADQRLNAINISHSIAMAYVMDQVPPPHFCSSFVCPPSLLSVLGNQP